jgi:DNA-binding transcriptional MerR regulator
LAITGFRAVLAAELVGVSYRQLDHWARTDVVRPSIANPRGPGTVRIYSYRDLVELKVIKRLLDGGVSFPAARRASESLRPHLEGELAEASLIMNGTRVLVARSGEEVLDFIRHDHGVLNVLALGPLVQDLDKKVHHAFERRAPGVMSVPETTADPGCTAQALPFAG